MRRSRPTFKRSDQLDEAERAAWRTASSRWRLHRLGQCSGM